ncbi:MAG: Fe-S cluster assembly protein SufD, partial [Pseudomonadota bacterium]
MALPKVKQDATDARLEAMSLPASGGWLKAAREAALARVRQMGLPSRRDEYWKYTRPETLVQPDAPQAATLATEEAPMFGEIDRVQIVFTDGVFDAAASDPLDGSGVTIERIVDVAETDIHWARDVYGLLEARGQEPVERPLAALNTAMATDGVLIHVSGQAAKPVNLTYHHKSETS